MTLHSRNLSWPSRWGGEHGLEERQLLYGVRADVRATAGQLVVAMGDSLRRYDSPAG